MKPYHLGGTSRRVLDALITARRMLGFHPPDRGPCKVCDGTRLVVQMSPELHDRWAEEVASARGQAVRRIAAYTGVPVYQLPTVRPDDLRVIACWSCMPLPPFPDDPGALARFLR